MAIFGKQKMNETDNNTDTKQPIKPSESLGSVLSESVPAASLDIIRSNTRFQLPDDEDKNARYVVAVLDVTYIGGLNKRCARNDPDKGQFIECINCGNIESYISEEGIANQTFVIIPTKKSLESLSEFSFLTRTENFARFIPACVTVDKNGTMEIKNYEAEVDYQWFLDICESKVYVTDAVKAFANEEFANANDAKESKKETLEETPATLENTIEQISRELYRDDSENKENVKSDEKPAENDNKTNYDNNNNNITDKVSEAKKDDMSDKKENDKKTDNSKTDSDLMIICPVCDSEMFIGQPCPACGFDLDGQSSNKNNDTKQAVSSSDEAVLKEEPTDIAGDSVNTEDMQDIDDADVLNAAERLFHASGLNLEISSEPFDLQFVKENKFEPISEDRNDGWLDYYVTQMIKNANAELRQMHKDNLFISRNRYLNLITEECELIATAVDINDPNNEYARCKQAIIDDTSKKRKSLDIEITKKRIELQKHWDDELQKIQESAAAAAKRNYLDKYSRAHEASLRDVEISLNSELDMEYSERLSQLNERRRDDAKKRHDLAVTQALVVIGESYEELLKEEEQRRNQLLSEIQEYIDNHRKEEVARNQVLAETQRQKEEAAKVTEDFTRKIDELTLEHAISYEKIKQELNVAYSQKTTLESEYNDRLDKEAAKYRELKEQYHTLMDKYVDIDNEKSKEYENRMNTLRNDKEAAEEHLAHVDMIHNKYNKISIVVWAAIAIAAFSIGAVFGSKFLAGNNANGHYSISFTSPEAEETITEASTEN